MGLVNSGKKGKTCKTSRIVNIVLEKVEGRLLRFSLSWVLKRNPKRSEGRKQTPGG